MKKIALLTLALTSIVPLCAMVRPFAFSDGGTLDTAAHYYSAKDKEVVIEEAKIETKKNIPCKKVVRNWFVATADRIMSICK